MKKQQRCRRVMIEITARRVIASNYNSLGYVDCDAVYETQNEMNFMRRIVEETSVLFVEEKRTGTFAKKCMETCCNNFGLPYNYTVMSRMVTTNVR